MLKNLPPINEGDLDWAGRGVILIQANISSKKGRESTLMTPKDEEHIRSLAHDRLKAVGNLYAVIGAPYLVKKNADVTKGVANGTLALLQDVLLDGSAKILIVNIGGSRYVHAVYAQISVAHCCFAVMIISWGL